MLHYVQQLVTDIVFVSLSEQVVHSSGFVRAFSLKTAAFSCSESSRRLKQRIDVVDLKTKTMSWKTFKRSIEIRGSAESGDNLLLVNNSFHITHSYVTHISYLKMQL